MSQNEGAFYRMRTPNDLHEAGFMITAAAHAIMVLLDKMSEAHDHKMGPWFDEIEQEIIRGAKGSVAEGVPIETEASGMGLGIEFVTALLNRERRALAKKAD